MMEFFNGQVEDCGFVIQLTGSLLEGEVLIVLVQSDGGGEGLYVCGLRQ